MTVGIISRFTLTRKLLRSMLSAIQGFRVLFDIPSVQEGIELIKELHPRILLVESTDSGEDIAVVYQLGKLFPEARVVLLTQGESDEFILRAIEAGARGCISKDSDPQILLKALNLVERGRFWVSREVADLIAVRWVKSQGPEPDTAEQLTPREWEILALLAKGQVNKEIAGHLTISENTVKAHLAAIYRKLHVTTRLAAALHYYQQARQRNVSPRLASGGSPSEEKFDALPSGVKPAPEHG